MRYNGLTSDVATGISNALAKDGQNVPTANISWGGFRLTNLAQAVATGDALGWGQNATVANLTATGTVSFGATTFTGAIAAPLGTVGAPSYSFTGDTNTGMWSAGADILTWSIGGVAAMQLQASQLTFGAGYVLAPGLGAVGAPTYTFNGDLNTGMWSPGADQLGFSTGGTQRIWVLSTGDVGIGVSPTTKLDVFGGYGVFRNGTYAGYFGQGTLLGGSGADLAIRSDNGILLGTGAGNLKATLSLAGDLGLGGTPNAYGAGLTAFTINATTTPVFDLNLSGTRNATFNVNAANVVFGSITNKDLQFYTNNTLKAALTADGRLYGTTLHNNAGAVTGTANQYLASGTYIPTATAVSNCTSPAAQKCQWSRTGNVVTVSGSCSLSVTAGGATATEIGLSLPIASNLAVASDLGGSHLCNIGITSGAARLDADTANDRARLFFSSSSTGPATLTFTFTYEVL